jgi:hypothetical protein
VVITNSDKKKFKINIMDSSNKNWQSTEITTDASASSFRSAIYKYYRDKLSRNNITVTREWLDAAGKVTAVSGDVVTITFTVTLSQRIKGLSSDKMSIAKVDTKASIVLNMPDSTVAGT